MSGSNGNVISHARKRIDKTMGGETKAQKMKDYLETTGYHLSNNSRIFLSVDGTMFPNASSILAKHNIYNRPLYRYVKNYSVVLGGPWAISPYRPHKGNQDPSMYDIRDENGKRLPPEDLSKALAQKFHEALATGDKTAGGMLVPEDFDDIDAAQKRIARVIELAPTLAGMTAWVGDSDITTEMFFKHLRRLNRIWVPKRYNPADNMSEIAEAAVSPYADFQQETHDFVLMRYCDANVLAQMLPVVDGSTQAKFLGPFHTMLFFPDYPWGDRLLHIKKRDDIKTPPAGPVKLSLSDVQDMAKQRMTAFTQIYTDRLLQTYPRLEKIPRADLLAKVGQYQDLGHDTHHFRRSDYLYQFIAMHILYEKDILQDEGAQQLMADNTTAPDEKLVDLREKYPLSKEDTL